MATPRMAGGGMTSGASELREVANLLHHGIGSALAPGAQVFFLQARMLVRARLAHPYQGTLAPVARLVLLALLFRTLTQKVPPYHPLFSLHCVCRARRLLTDQPTREKGVSAPPLPRTSLRILPP